MDRQQILDKIAAMLKLQESSNFEGQCSAAAELIDRLCAKYGVTLQEATTPQVLTESYKETGRLNDAEFRLFCAVARFYDAKGFVQYDNTGGRRIYTFKCVGTQGQQIQVQLYFEFLLEQMNKECEKAYKGEKILAEILGQTFTRAGFKSNFQKAFSVKVKERLDEIKLQREDHEHKQFTAVEIGKLKLSSRRMGTGYGWGAQLGNDSGSQVSLNKQAGGGQQLALAGR